MHAMVTELQEGVGGKCSISSVPHCKLDSHGSDPTVRANKQIHTQSCALHQRVSALRGSRRDEGPVPEVKVLLLDVEF